MHTWLESENKYAAAILFCVVLLSGGILNNTAYSFSQLNTVAWCACYVVAFIQLIRQYSWRWIPWFINHGILMTLVACFAGLSFFWTIDQPATILRTVIFAGGCVLAVYFVLQLTMDTILKFICYGLLCIIGINVLLIVVTPDIAIQNYAGEELVWKGWFNNKNVLAAPFALAALIAALKVKPIDSNINWLYAAVLVCSVFGLFKSDSATCILALAVGIGIYATFRALNQLSLSSSLIFLVAGVFIATVVFLFAIITGELSEVSNLTSVLGRSGDLTGRVDLWINTWQIITEKPMLGYGYGAIWSPLNDESIANQNVLLGIHWQEESVATAHNGLLQLASELGLPMAVFVGLTLFLIMYLKTVGALTRKNDQLYIQVAFLAFLIIHNIAETSLFRGRDIYWILAMLFILQLPSAAFQQKFANTKSKAASSKTRNSTSRSRRSQRSSSRSTSGTSSANSTRSSTRSTSGTTSRSTSRTATRRTSRSDSGESTKRRRKSRRKKTRRSTEENTH